MMISAARRTTGAIRASSRLAGARLGLLWTGVSSTATVQPDPDNTSHLEDNDYAEGDPGGHPPENNDNAALYGGFSAWTSDSERFQEDQDARERIEMLVSDYFATASEHADDLERGRRERLARELATRRLLKQHAQEDVWNDGDSDARGLILEDDTGRTVNPAHNAAHRHSRRMREIAGELRLWVGFQ